MDLVNLNKLCEQMLEIHGNITADPNYDKDSNNNVLLSAMMAWMDCINKGVNDLVINYDSNLKITEEKITKLEVELENIRAEMGVFADGMDAFNAKIQDIEGNLVEDFNSINVIRQQITQQETHQISQIAYQADERMASTPNWSHSTGVKLIPPKRFKGTRQEKPLEFLRDLRKYIDCVDPNMQQAHYIISQNLEAEAKDWFHIIENTINDWKSFESAFKARFWNDVIKRGIVRRLEVGFWKQDGISRVQYATQLISQAKDLENYDDAKIIKALYGHFGRSLKYSLLGQPIMSIQAFIELLAEIDLEDIKTKKNSSSDNNNKKEDNNTTNSNNNTSSGYKNNKFNNNNSENQKSSWKAQDKSFNNSRRNNNNNHSKNKDNKSQQVNTLQTVAEISSPTPETSQEN